MEIPLVSTAKIITRVTLKPKTLHQNIANIVNKCRWNTLRYHMRNIVHIQVEFHCGSNFKIRIVPWFLFYSHIASFTAKIITIASCNCIFHNLYFRIFFCSNNFRFFSFRLISEVCNFLLTPCLPFVFRYHHGKKYIYPARVGEPRTMLICTNEVVVLYFITNYRGWDGIGCCVQQQQQQGD